MSHPDYVRPSGQWPAENVPTAADWQRFDEAQSHALNGDDGGSWVPSSPIIIGGAGLQLATNTRFTGDVRTAQGGRLILGSGPSDFGTLGARFRTELWHLYEAISQLNGLGTQLEDERIALSQNPIGITLLTPADLWIPIPSRYLHSGANLLSVTLSYRVRKRPTAVPANCMRMQFVGMGDDAATHQALTPAWNIGKWNTGTVYALNSYITPSLGNSSGYYYKATAVAGTHTSGGTEPLWPTVIGNTVIDNAGANQITWTCVNTAGHIQRLVSGSTTVISPDVYFNNGAPQSVVLVLDGTNTLDALPIQKYSLGITNPDSNILLHSVKFSFSGITSLAFE